MAGQGPTPKEDGTRARRNPTVAMTRLPSGGYQGVVPIWPLIEDLRLTTERMAKKAQIADLEVLADDAELTPAKRARLDQKIAKAKSELLYVEAKLARQAGLEQAMWEDLWRTPQAAAWAQLGWSRDVATYARLSVHAELGDLDSLKEARMWSDRLGLTPMAMLRLRWKVSSDEVGQQRTRGARQSAGAASRYGGLKVVGTSTAGTDEA